MIVEMFSSALIILILVPTLIFRKFRHHDNGTKRSLVLFISGLAVSTFVIGSVVNVLLMLYGCSGNSGPHCELELSIFSVPVAFIIGMLTFLAIWVRFGSHNE